MIKCIANAEWDSGIFLLGKEIDVWEEDNDGARFWIGLIQAVLRFFLIVAMIWALIYYQPPKRATIVAATGQGDDVRITEFYCQHPALGANRCTRDKEVPLAFPEGYALVATAKCGYGETHFYLQESGSDRVYGYLLSKKEFLGEVKVPLGTHLVAVACNYRQKPQLFVEASDGLGYYEVKDEKLTRLSIREGHRLVAVVQYDNFAGTRKFYCTDLQTERLGECPQD